MDTVVDELRKLGVDMRVSRIDKHGTYNAYTEDSIMRLHIIHGEHKKHYNTGHLYFKFNFYDETDEIIQEVNDLCRETWGKFYFSVDDAPIGLYLDCKGNKHTYKAYARHIFDMPKCLARDIEPIYHTYLKLLKSIDNV